LVTGMGKRGTTVFLTTHDMDEADRLCHRVAIIDRGRVVAMGAPRALRLAHGQRAVRVLRRDGLEETFSLERQEGAEGLAALIAAGEVQSVHSQEATLEEAFLALTGRRLAE
jgi:ABC-2 type transport system ATP-binding protein